MASYLQGVSDTGFNTPLYTPDFSFLASNMQKKETQYLKGLSEVSAGYNAIVNAPVTGEEAQKRKSEYAQAASDGLNKLSTEDLSLPTSTAQAEKLYAPFYQDDVLVMNIGNTKIAKSQLSTLDSWQNSKDEDVRKQYSDLSRQDIMNGLEELANAPWSKDAYSKLSKRRATPVYDTYTEAVNAYTKLMGTNGLTSTSVSGPVQTITTNGPQSFNSFKTFYLSFAQQDRYKPQNRMIARVGYENDIKQIKQYNQLNGLPIDDASIKQSYGAHLTSQLKNYYESGIDAYREQEQEILQQIGKIVPVNANGQPVNGEQMVTQEQKDQIVAYKQQAQHWGNLANDLQSQYTKKLGYVPGQPLNITNETYQATLQQLSTFPEDYIDQLYIGEQADKFAAGMASLTRHEVKEFSGWDKYNQAESRNYNDRLKALELQRKVDQGDRKLDIQQEQMYRKYGVIPDGWTADEMETYISSGGSSSSASKSNSGINILSGTVHPVTGNYVTHIKHPIDVFEAQQNTRKQRINYGTFSDDGLAGILNSPLISNSMSTSDVMNFSHDMIEQGNGTILTDPKYQQSRNKVNEIFRQNGLEQYATGKVDDYRMGLLQLNAKMGEDIAGSNDLSRRSLGINILRQYKDMKKEMETFNANETQYNTIVTDELRKNYPHLINPQTGIQYTINDMAPDFPELHLVDENGNKRTLSPSEYAKIYRDGNLKSPISFYNNMGRVPYIEMGDGHKYMMQGMSLNGRSPQDLREINQWSDHITRKYHKINTAFDEAGKKAAANLQSFNKDGLSTGEVVYDISGTGKDINQSQKATGVDIYQRIILPSNSSRVYTTSGNMEATDLPDEEKQALQNGNYIDFIRNNIGSISYVPVGPNGVPAIRINMQTHKSDSDKEELVGGVSIGDLKKHEKIYFDISEHSIDPILTKFPKRETYRYQSLLQGQGIDSDELEKSHGFEYHVIPDMNTRDVNGQVQRVVVETKSWKFDDNGRLVRDGNGNPIWTDIQKHSINLKDVNPDELMNTVDQWMITSSSTAYDKLKYSQSNPSVAPGTKMYKVSDIFKQIQ